MWTSPVLGQEAASLCPLPPEICSPHEVRAGRDLSDHLLLQMSTEKERNSPKATQDVRGKAQGATRCSDLSPGLTCYTTLCTIERSWLLNE